jgi:hypothetical protein
VNRVWSPDVWREGTGNLLCSGMLAIILQIRMRRHVTANFNFEYISVQPENTGTKLFQIAQEYNFGTLRMTYCAYHHLAMKETRIIRSKYLCVFAGLSR